MYLHEEILLLVLNDDTGKTDWKAGMFQYVMAGAIIAELLLEERIALSGKKKKIIGVNNPAPHPNTVINDALTLIKKPKTEKSVQHWVQKLASMKGLKEDTARNLCEQGILKQEKGKVLFIFPAKTYPSRNPEPERQLIERLRQAIFNEGNVDPRTAILISLTYQTEILAIAFNKKELKQQKRRMKAITSGEVVGEATAGAISAVQSAVMIVAIMPAITAASCPPTSSC